MLLACVPHAIMTWSAMQPVLARRTAAMTSTWQFLLRLSLIVVALAALAVALYPAPLRLK